MAKRKKTSPLSRLAHDHEALVYETTTRDAELWYRILNKEIFNNRLPPTGFDIRWRRKQWACFVSYANVDLCYIALNKRYPSKQMFVEVLAHEMVHFYQRLTYGYSFEEWHGQSFFYWQDRFERKGLRLVVKYDYEKI